MNCSATANKFSALKPASLPLLEDCTEESIYAPGYIQSHGILLVLQLPDLQILQASENVEQFLGISATALLGEPLQRLFSPTQVKRIRLSLKQDQWEYGNSFNLKTRSGGLQPQLQQKAQTFRGTLHRTSNALILELEPLLTRKRAAILQVYHQVQMVTLKLRSANSLSELAQVLAREVKIMTGCDRVMIYQFEPDDHGTVIAEAKAPHLDSYLGLHYPATDIPLPARNLFRRHWVRHIPDVHGTPACLIPPQLPTAAAPLDLSSCVLRGVSPYHTQYLQNMGVASSLTISLIDDKRLWGLIACHHYSPYWLDYETRKTCEFIGQFASIELVHQQERELNTYRTQVRNLQSELQRAFLQEPNFIQQVLTHNGPALLDLVHAQGAAILLNDTLTCIGQTPALAEVRDLITWLQERQDQSQADPIFATDALSQLYPAATAFSATASGVLAISIVLGPVTQRSYRILWFRPEHIQTVNWAGNPQDSVTTDEIGAMRLCPRQSFELWKETVQEQSYPWQQAELEVAAEMRNTLMLAVLEFSQMALEQAAERAAIANRAKSQFLAKMSHELRTPLNAILGFAQVMNRNPQIPLESQEHLRIINRSGEHLLTLINDVLEMSKIEAGQLVLTEQHFNLHRLLRSLQEMFALKAAQKGLTLAFEADSSVPHYVCSDEAKLRQILINLMSNAIKFTAQGSVVVRVQAEVTSAAPQRCGCNPSDPPPCQALRLYFAIEDTGCGIERQDWELIFEAFMQTERGRYAEGTGLGLCISRQFARLMGGDITVQSVVHQGSTFTCQVLVRQPAAQNLLKSETHQIVIGLEPAQPTYRILIAEDVPENRQLLVTLLEPIGFEVQTAENGKAAIAQWQTWQPHLILMDIQMPDMGGYEATRQIRALEAAEAQERQEAGNPRTPPHTLIIALTAYAFESDRADSLEVGCDEYIAKPFSETTLFEAIARHTGVRYRYKPPLATSQSLTVKKTLTPHDLRMMPTDWFAQMHEAALDLRDDRLHQLIGQIPESEHRLIAALTSLVDNFQLEAIATLTQA
ncbi:MAG: ATP-binding protein [Leptolyngbyaceae cyanobacterium bins.349]|nr:ATP-binding protein [Leptolyngbyaceae cyanobacterium bins.349]